MIAPRAALAASLIALSFAACSPGPPPDRALDESAARSALTEALDSWKAGRPHASPSESDPTLRVADEDWLSGARLIDYRVLPGEEVVGPRLNFPVSLVIEGPNGRRIKKRVAYTVATDPSPSVIRQD